METDTRISVAAGDLIELEASGRYTATLGFGIVNIMVTLDANGIVLPIFSLGPYADRTTGSLIALVGGRSFQAGTNTRVSMPVAGTLQLAINVTGSGTGHLSVHVFRTRAARVAAPIRVASQEVTQSIQLPDNSVPLVAGRGTIVRVVVESLLTDGTDFGSGPNVVPSVTGVLTVLDEDGGAMNTRTSITPYITVARPAGQVNRNIFEETLNFFIPGTLCSGTRTFEAQVFRTSSSSEVAEGRTTVSFQARPRQQLTPILLRDTVRNIGPPTIEQFMAELPGPQSRFPFADDGIIVNPWWTMDTWLLGNMDGWRLLITHMQATPLWGGSGSAEGVRAGLAPTGSAAPTSDGLGMPRIAAHYPAFFFIQRGSAFSQYTMAHELAHTMGFLHLDACGAPCPWGGGPTRIEAPGMNVGMRAVIPAGTGSLMTYCDAGAAWPSVQMYRELFAKGPTG